MCNKSHNLVLLSRTFPFSVSHSFTRHDSTPHLSLSLSDLHSLPLSPPPTHDPIFAFLKLSLIRFFVNLLSFCFFEYHLLISFLLMLSRPILFKWTIPGLSFFIFVYSKHVTVKGNIKFLPIFEPRTSGVGSVSSTN